MIPVIFSTNPLASNEAARGAKRLARSARRRSSSCPTLGECETNGHGVKVICQDLHLDFVETKKRNKQWFGKKTNSLQFIMCSPLLDHNLGYRPFLVKTVLHALYV